MGASWSFTLILLLVLSGDMLKHWVNRSLVLQILKRIKTHDSRSTPFMVRAMSLQTHDDIANSRTPLTMTIKLVGLDEAKEGARLSTSSTKIYL